MVKAVKTPAAQIVTGNRLRDGAVIYLAGDSQWSTDIAQGAVAHDAAEANRLMAVANQAAVDRVVVNPYLIEVAVAGDSIQPVGTRERIRAFGPSIATPPSDRLPA
ncbi:MAG TPA: DUF2849 domain-containing protein [Alphaproteobacteria bacterium]